MKIELEHQDSIEFKSTRYLAKLNSKEYTTRYECAIRGNEGHTIENINAEFLFGQICGEKKIMAQREITDYVAHLLGFDVLEDTKNTDGIDFTQKSDTIQVKTDKLGLMLEINGAAFDPEELKKAAFSYKDDIGVTL
ncbi:MAG: hypothetical protein IKA36_04580 [Clostridia bacterium]|nr:hypothetical protein [Clostridia bacterium]